MSRENHCPLDSDLCRYRRDTSQFLNIFSKVSIVTLLAVNLAVYFLTGFFWLILKGRSYPTTSVFSILRWMVVPVVMSLIFIIFNLGGIVFTVPHDFHLI